MNGEFVLGFAILFAATISLICAIYTYLIAMRTGTRARLQSAEEIVNEAQEE